MDKYTKKSMNTYNDKANDYTNTRDYRVTKKLKYEFIEYLGTQSINNKNLLDIACGMGDLLNELYKEYNKIDKVSYIAKLKKTGKEE